MVERLCKKYSQTYMVYAMNISQPKSQMWPPKQNYFSV